MPRWSYLQDLWNSTTVRPKCEQWSCLRIPLQKFAHFVVRNVFDQVRGRRRSLKQMARVRLQFTISKRKNISNLFPRQQRALQFQRCSDLHTSSFKTSSSAPCGPSPSSVTTSPSTIPPPSTSSLSSVSVSSTVSTSWSASASFSKSTFSATV